MLNNDSISSISSLLLNDTLHYLNQQVCKNNSDRQIAFQYLQGWFSKVAFHISTQSIKLLQLSLLSLWLAYLSSLHSFIDPIKILPMPVAHLAGLTDVSLFPIRKQETETPLDMHLTTFLYCPLLLLLLLFPLPLPIHYTECKISIFGSIPVIIQSPIHTDGCSWNLVQRWGHCCLSSPVRNRTGEFVFSIFIYKT